MQIIVRGHKLKITSAIREYARKKMSKTGKFFTNIQQVLVELEVQHIKNKEKSQIAHVTIELAGKVLRANEADPDIYTALDKVFDKLEKQIKKHHEKLKDKREAKKNARHIKPVAVTKRTGVSRSAANIKFTNTSKPMDPKEAVLEFQLSDQDHFIFKNPRNGSLNVLYKINNGDFGLSYTKPLASCDNALGWQRGIWNNIRSFFVKKEVDSSFGEESIKEIRAIGKIKSLSVDEALNYSKENDQKYLAFRNKATKKVSLLCLFPKNKYNLVETNY
jgi:ribosome hibernation promoting factor